LGAPDENDVVCDYFAGSGTTGHAVWEQNRQDKKNRKFILIQLPELCDKESQAYKAGYETIADICKERIRRAAKKIKEESRQQKLTGTKQDLGFKVFKLAKSNYRIWEDYDGKDADELKKQTELFTKPLVDGYDDTDVIYEVIVKEGYGLNSRIEKADVSTNRVYRVTDADSSFFITLDTKINAKTLDRLDLSKDTTFVCIDDSLDDSQKNNISMRCNLKTI
jgi:adenine-specific DNA-methyltransferase